MTYRITFACYGCHLHGSESGSVDPAHNVPGTPILERDSARTAFEEQRMDQSPYHLDQIRRDTRYWKRFRTCARIVGGICWRPMCAAITCTRWWKRRFRRIES